MESRAKYLELTGRFQTRVAAMDAEHQRLVDIINHMYELYQNEGTEEELFTVLDELLEYGAHHFADEEAYMAQNGVPTLEAHRKVHKNLIEQVVLLKKRLQSGEEGVGEYTFKFLQNWLMGHIVGTDIKEYGMSEPTVSELSDEELEHLANSLENKHN